MEPDLQAESEDDRQRPERHQAWPKAGAVMSYKVILQDQYDLSPLVEAISLRDSLEQVAYQGTVNLVVTPDMPPISPGMAIRISGIPYGKRIMFPRARLSCGKWKPRITG